MEDRPEENLEDSAIIDGIGDVNSPKFEEKPTGDDYEISRNALSLYFHLTQFLPALILIFLLCLAVFLPAWGAWLAGALFFFLYIVFYKTSSLIADRCAKSVDYKLENDVLTAKTLYCGFYSQKKIALDQVEKITLVQSPLMRFCKIWAIDIISPNSRVRLYGLKNAARLCQSLLYARAGAINKRSAH